MNESPRPSPEFLRDWVSAQKWFTPGKTAVMTAGSLNDLQPHESLPGDSDIDIWSFNDADVALPAQEKHRAGEFTIESEHFPLARLERGEAVAGDAFLAPNLLAPWILFDPHGTIADAAHVVSTAYYEPRWAALRVKAEYEESRSHLAGYVKNPVSTLDFLLGVHGLPNIMLIAACRRPTFRKAFVYARALCVERGDAALHEELLSAIGIDNLSKTSSLAMRDRCLEILNVSVAVRKTPFWGDFEIQPFRIAHFESFVSMCIDEGLHREAAVHILFMAYWAMLPLWLDLDASETVGQQALYDEIAGAVGLLDTEAKLSRALRLLRFLETRLGSAVQSMSTKERSPR